MCVVQKTRANAGREHTLGTLIPGRRQASIRNSTCDCRGSVSKTRTPSTSSHACEAKSPPRGLLTPTRIKPTIPIKKSNHFSANACTIHFDPGTRRAARETARAHGKARADALVGAAFGALAPKSTCRVHRLGDHTIRRIRVTTTKGTATAKRPISVALGMTFVSCAQTNHPISNSISSLILSF